MIGEDRLKLNERFIQIFELLEQRGDISANSRDGRGIGDFADRVLGNRGYGHIIRAFLNPDDKRVIDYKHIKKLCQVFGVSEQYMLYGMGSPFGMDLPISDSIVQANTLRPNILFTSVRAFAGNTIGTDGREDTEFYAIPGIAGGDFVSFPITGDSMEPVIKNGDIVICKKIESLMDIKEGEMYAVKNNGQLWIKYVKTITNNRGRIVRLRMISANFLEYDPFEEEVNEYTQLFKVTKRISSI